MIYLREHPLQSITGRTVAEWNCGSTLAEALDYLKTRHGFAPKEVLHIWNQLRDQWKDGAVQWRPQPDKNTAQWYTDWKGTTGEGAMCKKIIANCT